LIQRAGRCAAAGRCPRVAMKVYTNCGSHQDCSIARLPGQLVMSQASSGYEDVNVMRGLAPPPPDRLAAAAGGGAEEGDSRQDHQDGHHRGAAETPLAVGMDRVGLAVGEIGAEAEADQRRPEGDRATDFTADR